MADATRIIEIFSKLQESVPASAHNAYGLSLQKFLQNLAAACYYDKDEINRGNKLVLICKKDRHAITSMITDVDLECKYAYGNESFTAVFLQSEKDVNYLSLIADAVACIQLKKIY